MSLVSWAKKELARFRVQKNRRLLLPQSSLTTAKSLPLPSAQEVILAADLRCSECQKRISEYSHKLMMWSLWFFMYLRRR